MAQPAFEELAVGQEVARREIAVDRSRLVRYAGASGDFNPIHWNERFATEVGLPGVIAHGMWTMGAAVGVVSDWVGDPGAVLETVVGAWATVGRGVQHVTSHATLSLNSPSHAGA